MEEKNALHDKLNEEKAAQPGPAARTRSQTQPTPLTPAEPTNSDTKQTTARLQQAVNINSTTCLIMTYDGPTSHSVVGRGDDGSDKSLAFPTLA